MYLLLGGSGFVGSAFQDELQRRGATYRNLSRSECDYTSFSSLVRLLRDTRPTFLVNCAGYAGKPNVDACETARADTLLGNVVLPQTIAQACEVAGVPWGHVSSGCIYSGAKLRLEKATGLDGAQHPQSDSEKATGPDGAQLPQGDSEKATGPDCAQHPQGDSEKGSDPDCAQHPQGHSGNRGRTPFQPPFQPPFQTQIQPDLMLPELQTLWQRDRSLLSGFAEDDPPNFSFRAPPCSFYSGSKALGEEVLAGAPETYIWRLRIPFDGGANPRNYLSKICNYARVYDNANSLSHRADFARACLDLWELRATFGVYNVTNPGWVTTRDVAAKLRVSLHREHDFDFFESDQEFYATAASTPRSNTILDTTKIQATGIRFRSVDEALDEAITEFANHRSC